MPKPTTDTLLADLTSRLTKLAEVARKEGRDDALAEIRCLIGGVGTASAAARKSKPAASKPAKSGKKRKNPWASMTPKQKAERVRKMLAGRGLKPKSERKPASKSKPRKKTTRRKTK